MTQSVDICVFGSINADVCVYADRAAASGETRAGTGYALNLGGKGANQAIAAHRLGAKVRLFAATGDDLFAHFVRSELERFGLPSDDVALAANEPTGIASILVDANGANAITIVGGANLSADEDAFAKLAAALGPTGTLLLQCERASADTLRAARIARAAGARVILDPAPVPSDGSLAALADLVDIVTPNETETMAIVGILPSDAHTTHAAAQALHRLGFRTLVLKLGSRGAFVSAPGIALHVEAPRVASIDSVAAGDCFNASLAVRLAAGADLAAAVLYACAAGAISVTRTGAAASAPTAAEVEALLAGR